MAAHLSYFGLGDFPDQVYRFAVPTAGIRRWDDAVLVYDVRVVETTGLRHYAFYDRWFVVNMSLDRSGDLRAERGHGLDWCFNCDVTTPLFSVGDDAVYSVDLELDVLAGPDGKMHVVKDQDKFAASVAAGYIDENEENGARRGLADLLEIVNGEGLNAFVARIFLLEENDIAVLPIQPPVTLLSPADVPLLLPDARRARYGQKG